MRRVGKSVIMRQIMEFVGQNTPPKNICQASFDEELVNRNPDILDHIISSVIAGVPKDNSGRIFFFIDEIQFVKNWQHILKRYYDRQPEIKFIISGSSSLFIQKKTTESLSGRVIEFAVQPLSFWEYLLLSNQDSASAQSLSVINVDLENFDESRVMSALEDIIIAAPNISDKFDEYLLRGQFPEVVSWPEEEARNYIRNSTYKKTLLYDIPRLFQIRRPDELAFLYNILMRESANLLEINNLASSAGINRNTIGSYLGYLKEALLHLQLPNSTSSAREERRLLKKGYVPSPNFSAAFLKLSQDHPLWQQEAGHLAETFIAGVLSSRFGDSVRFYRKDDVEVDFIVSSVPGRFEGAIMAEVKYSDSIQRRELKNLLRLAEKTRARSVFCFTRNTVKVEKEGKLEVIHIPAWAF
ncbi:MAG: ATP-binding protein [Deltaproteobacteria bacterium]|nr:ATP-binding protein [Deltaproteobacteria bacterium]